MSGPRGWGDGYLPLWENDWAAGAAGWGRGPPWFGSPGGNAYRAVQPVLNPDGKFPPMETERDFIFAKWNKYPDASLDFTLKASRWINRLEDVIASVSLTASPGDIVLSDLIVANNRITFTASGGVPRRLYTIKCTATMTNGRIFVFVEDLWIRPSLRSDLPPVQIYPVPVFGEPLTWTFAPSLNWTQPRNGSLRLFGWN